MNSLSPPRLPTTHAMKDFERIDRLRREWSDKYVEADASVPSLRRFAGRVGRVMTINMNGHALVQFTGTNDIGWYDVDLARLRIVAEPALAPKPTEGPAKPKAPPRDVVEASTANVRRASAEEAAKEFADETVDSLTAELAIQAVDPSSETTMSDDSVDSLAATEAPIDKPLPSTAGMLAAARTAKAATPPGQATSTAEILAQTRSKKIPGADSTPGKNAPERRRSSPDVDEAEA